MKELLIKVGLEFLDLNVKMLLGGLIIGMKDSIWMVLDMKVKEYYGVVEPLYKEVKSKKKWF